MRTSHVKLITLEGQYYRKSHQTKKNNHLIFCNSS